MGTVVMYASVSVDAFVADEDDQAGPLFDWLLSGDVPLDGSGVLKVSQASYDYVRPYWDQIGATIVGRHVFHLTNGWDGTPPGGVDHVVVVTHRPPPETRSGGTSHLSCSGPGSATSGRCTPSTCWRSPVIQGDRVLHLRYRVRR